MPTISGYLYGYMVIWTQFKRNVCGSEVGAPHNDKNEMELLESGTDTKKLIKFALWNLTV